MWVNTGQQVQQKDVNAQKGVMPTISQVLSSQGCGGGMHLHSLTFECCCLVLRICALSADSLDAEIKDHELQA